ncbi:MAG: hypothetical protein HKN76_05915, partial [Saprospiraceae bacterium]|nr:hypothetical protein [Saprospiraceae bacterium]
MKPLAIISAAVVAIILISVLWQEELSFVESEPNPVIVNPPPPCANPDSAALMALFNATNGPAWTNRSNWGDTCDVCLWYGVNCNMNNRVQALSLPLNNLNGEIPPDLADLTFLESIDFSSNELSVLASEITSLPLKTLNISNNLFSGNLPPEISNLASTLEEFKLTNNNFSGAIPPEIGGLSNLRVLTMENNNFSSIPAEIGNLSNLEIWYCGGMSITSLPGAIGNLVSLKELYLSFNDITSLPMELGSLANIREIYIEFNLLGGEIPSSFGNLSTLEVLSLEGNFLSGPIPLEMANMAELRFLYLGSNNLTGPLHPEIGSLPNLQRLEVFDNNLNGCIPPSYASLCDQPFSFYYDGNPCLWQGSVTEFCNGTPCSFSDYSLTVGSPSICAGSSSTLATTGGSSFLWSTGESTANITVSPLFDTWYYLTLTTTAGCVRMDSTLIQVNELPVASASGTDVTISGGSDGSATAIVVSGQVPYNYAWNTGATTQTITGLSAGAYYITVTDANGCNDSASVVINEPACPIAGTPCDDGDPGTYNDQEDGACDCSGTNCPTLLTNLTFVNNTCFGETAGYAIVDPTQGSPPYVVIWSNGATEYDISDLSTGAYSVTVADANGCSAINSFSIIEPPEMISSLAVIDESYPGANDGSIDLTVIGGAGNYSFLWSNGITTEDLTGLAGNGTTYGVTITDILSCQIVDQTTVETICLPAGSPCDDGDQTTYGDEEDGSCGCTGLPCPVIQTNIFRIDVSCANAADGSARVTPAGGVAPYSIRWSTGDSLPEIEDVVAGEYSVTITDKNGCSSTSLVTVLEPSPLEVALNKQDESAPGAEDGAITTTVSGGTFPYSYSWSTSAHSKNLTDLAGGNLLYVITVSDSRGCEAVDSIRLQTGCLT